MNPENTQKRGPFPYYNICEKEPFYHYDSILFLSAHFYSSRIMLDSPSPGVSSSMVSTSSASFLRYFTSCSFGRDGLPNTWSTLLPRNIRWEPMPSAILVKLVTCTIGIPALSISFVITAPQRELVPQVLVSMTASIFWSFRLFAISSPNFFPISMGVITPAVV